MNNNDSIESRIRNDRFAAIQYETRKSKRGTVIGLELTAHFVFRWIFQDAWKHISASVATAASGKFYTAESLFNDSASWAEYGHAHRVAIGRALVYFIDHGMLPLFCVNPNASGTKQYVLLD